MPRSSVRSRGDQRYAPICGAFALFQAVLLAAACGPDGRPTLAASIDGAAPSLFGDSPARVDPYDSDAALPARI